MPRHRLARRLRPLALLAALVASASSAETGEALGISHRLSPEHPPGSTYMGLRLLGTLDLHASTVGEGHALHSLSALGYDEDADLVYALSDRGVLFHLRLTIENDLLQQAHAVAAHPLTDVRGRPLRGMLSDGEGMVLRGARNGVEGDTEILVSFERRPRVMVFDPHGEPKGSMALPALLRNSGNYRGSNKALEAITVHPTLGVLVAAEQPLRAAAPDTVVLHAIEDDLRWGFQAPLDPNHALVAIEALPDGRVVTLERAHGFLFVPFITVVRMLPRLPADGGELTHTEVGRFSTGYGFVLDNFEGLTRHRGMRFLMVSDDNAKPFQATLLSYFEIVDGESDGEAPAQ